MQRRVVWSPQERAAGVSQIDVEVEQETTVAMMVIIIAGDDATGQTEWGCAWSFLSRRRLGRAKGHCFMSTDGVCNQHMAS